MDSDYRPQGMTFSLYTRTSSTKKLYTCIYQLSGIELLTIEIQVFWVRFLVQPYFIFAFNLDFSNFDYYFHSKIRTLELRLLQNIEILYENDFFLTSGDKDFTSYYKCLTSHRKVKHLKI